MDKITDISGNNVLTSAQTCIFYFYCSLQVIYSIQIQKYKKLLFFSQSYIYRTGSIVIQGSKCTFFKQIYFKVLKKAEENVKNTCNNEEPYVSIQNNENSGTVPKFIK